MLLQEPCDAEPRAVTYLFLLYLGMVAMRSTFIPLPHELGIHALQYLNVPYLLMYYRQL